MITGLVLAVVAALLVSACGVTRGEEASGLHRLRMMVPNSPGGGYDLYGRLVSEYMQRYLPGSIFIVKNVPGAGNIVGTNLLYASKPDGLTIGTFNTGLIYAQMIGREGIRFDLTKLSWIGKASSDPRVITINAKSPIKSFADFMAVNPKGYVPALQMDDGEVLTEGPAIVQYLGDKAPASGLVPANGTMERYRLQETLGFINSEIHKTYSPLFDPSTPDAVKAGLHEKLRRISGGATWPGARQPRS